jgi:hypothetical protein
MDRGDHFTSRRHPRCDFSIAIFKITANHSLVNKIVSFTDLSRLKQVMSPTKMLKPAMLPQKIRSSFGDGMKLIQGFQKSRNSILVGFGHSYPNLIYSGEIN